MSGVYKHQKTLLQLRRAAVSIIISSFSTEQDRLPPRRDAVHQSKPARWVLTIITRLPVVELKADALKRLLYANRVNPGLIPESGWIQASCFTH